MNTSKDNHSDPQQFPHPFRTEREPLQLWYDRPALHWDEALPLGDRDHGPDILEQVRDTFVREDYAEADRLWRGMHGPYSARYLPAGDLLLDFPVLVSCQVV